MIGSLALWLLYLLLLLAGIAGLVLNIVGLPGIWLIPLAAIVYKLLPISGPVMSWTAILATVGVGIVAEIAEFAAGALGSAKAGGSKRGMVGALLGGLVGAIAAQVLVPIPIVGAILGAVLGSFIGAYLFEFAWTGKSHGHAFRIGVGAAKGRVMGLVIKSVCGCVMLLIVLITAWPWGY
ncbi:MAG: DUF456 domain-containing protein [Tepidisphaeraceae bacterium]